MKKIALFMAFFAGVLAFILCGCSDPAAEKAANNAAIRAEVQEILETIHIVDKKMLTSVDRGDIVNSDILQIIEKFKRLKELTGVTFYAWVISDPNSEHFPAEQYKKLTERTPGIIPFYVEDDLSGAIYFAPPPEQEFIIGKYKEWFDRQGGVFDFDALQKIRTNKK